MRVAEQLTPPTTPVVPGDAVGQSVEDWAVQTRRVLTRDLLVRAAYAAPGEARALEFRALHLNLPLVGDVARRLGLGEAELALAEHDALDALCEAVRAFDPYGEREFTEVAEACVERRLTPYRRAGRALPRRRPVRLAAHRIALLIAGYRI
ncbi:MAG TPA: hypothetical protein VFJ89_09505 [Nocardioides sp.]|jgi:hypothetical protein|nr:hypothetical protein [Nocardioides sp.]